MPASTLWPAMGHGAEDELASRALRNASTEKRSRMSLKLLFWLKWMQTRAQWLLSGSPHPFPAVRKLWFTRLDPPRLRAEAEAERRITLPIGGHAVELDVRPVLVLDGPVEVVEIDERGGETRSEVDALPTYIGAVGGRDVARLTITDRSVTGYVHLGSDWWFIDPLQGWRGAGDHEYGVYKTSEVFFRHPVQFDSLDGEFIPIEGEPRHSAGPEIGIAMWADASYETQVGYLGLSWWEAQAALINDLNGVYQEELGVQFRIRRFTLDHRSSPLSSDNAETLLNQFGQSVRNRVGDLRQVAVRESTGIEIAHLTTARNLDGSTIGVAWKPGVWSLSQQRISVSFSGIRNLTYENLLLACHEIGHNFNGDHDAAEEFCVTEFIICLDHERTIMWPVLYSDNRDDFSDENDQRITSNMAFGRNATFTHP